MRRRPDVLERLVRALVGSAPAAVAVRHAASRPWASATFVGARHRITLFGVTSAELDGWIAGLPAAEFDLPGALVADLAVVAVLRDSGVELDLEILTLECWP